MGPLPPLPVVAGLALSGTRGESRPPSKTGGSLCRPRTASVSSRRCSGNREIHRSSSRHVESAAMIEHQRPHPGREAAEFARRCNRRHGSGAGPLDRSSSASVCAKPAARRQRCYSIKAMTNRQNDSADSSVLVTDRSCSASASVAPLFDLLVV